MPYLPGGITISVNKTGEGYRIVNEGGPNIAKAEFITVYMGRPDHRVGVYSLGVAPGSYLDLRMAGRGFVPVLAMYKSRFRTGPDELFSTYLVFDC